MPWTPRSSRSRYRTPAAWRPTSHSSSPPSSPCSSRPGSLACSPPSSTPRNATRPWRPCTPTLPGAAANRCSSSLTEPATADRYAPTSTPRSPPTCSPARSSTVGSSLTGPSPQTSSTTSSRTYSPPGRQKPPTDTPRTGPLQQARPPGQPAACIAGRLDNDSRPTPRPRERRIHLRLNADAFTPSDLPARSSEHAPYSAKRRPADVVGRSSGNCRPRLRCPVPSTPEFAQKSSRLATNSGEVVRRWRSPAMSIWSVHARRTVPTQRSATGVGPRRLGRDADDLDADGGEHRVEGGTELAVPVAQ